MISESRGLHLHYNIQWLTNLRHGIQTFIRRHFMLATKHTTILCGTRITISGWLSRCTWPVTIEARNGNKGSGCHQTIPSTYRYEPARGAKLINPSLNICIYSVVRCLGWCATTVVTLLSPNGHTKAFAVFISNNTMEPD